MVQNGKIPKFLNQEMLEGIFQKPEATLSPSLFNLRKGLQKTGIYQVGKVSPLRSFLVCLVFQLRLGSIFSFHCFHGNVQ